MRIAALLASAALAFAPAAHAAIAQIVGTGTGGSIGLASSAAAGSTVVDTTNVDVPPGSLIIVGVAWRSAAQTFTGCADSAGNSYSPSQANYAVGSNVQRIYSSFTATDLPSGGTITCTLTQSNSAGRMIDALAFSGAAGVTYNAAASATPTTGTTTTTSITSNALPAGGGILIGLNVTATGTTASGDSPLTAAGAVSSSSTLHMAFEIVSGTSAVTWAPTWAAASTWGAMLQDFAATSRHDTDLLGL